MWMPVMLPGHDLNERVAGGETVIMLHPPLPWLGVSMRMERGCRHNGSLADGQRPGLGRAGHSRHRPGREAPLPHHVAPDGGPRGRASAGPERASSANETQQQPRNQQRWQRRGRKGGRRRGAEGWEERVGWRFRGTQEKRKTRSPPSRVDPARFCWNVYATQCNHPAQGLGCILAKKYRKAEKRHRKDSERERVG